MARPAAGVPRPGRRRERAQGRRGGPAERRVRHLLPRGDRHAGPGPVADGGQDRGGAAGPVHRRAGDPGGALGSPGRPAVRKLQAARAAAPDRAYSGRPAGRPVRLRRPAADQPDAARGHRRHHGRHHPPAGRAARAGAAGRAVPSGDRPPQGPAGAGQRAGRPGTGRGRRRTATRPNGAPRRLALIRGNATVRAAVMGAGSWGTTFAQVLCDAGTPAVLWCRRPELSAAIGSTRQNADYLPGITLAEALRVTADPAEALQGADLVVLAVPAQSLRQNLASWVPLLPPGALLVSLMKGIELGSCDRMSEVIGQVAGAPQERIAVVSGPNLAREIARREHAATVVACTDNDAAERLQRACHTGYFRPYTNPDVIGCELGGAVKNVIALAVGMAAGMGLGDNTRAMLITRGLAETARLGAALGADQHTFSGLAGMGDLVATCSSPLSRNRTVGENLGRGMAMAEVLASTRQTAEGVKSSQSVLELARRHGVEMPITEVMVAVMHDDLEVGKAALMLASRSARPERYGL